MPRKPDIRTIYAAVAAAVGTLLLGLLFWHVDNTDPMWGVAAFILVYDPNPQAAYKSAISRAVYTLLGCGLSVVAILALGLHKWLLPVSLGLTMFICGYFLQFRPGWRTLVVCVALVIGTSLTDPDGDMQIAVMRSIEVAVGSLLAVAFSLPLVWLNAK